MGLLIQKSISLVILVFGICILCGGIIFVCVLPSIIRQRVEEAVTLKPDTSATKSWAEPPVTASMQFWIFNVTNPNEIVFQGAKPQLVQKGPYGFREQLQKRSLSFFPNNSVSYFTQKTYFFDANLSCSSCRLDDAFTIPNIPYLTVMKLIRGQRQPKPILDFLGGLLLRLVGEHPFVGDVKARQILFEGYDDPIFKLVNQFKPGLVPEKMGIFYKRNGSQEGPYVVHSGQDDITQLGQIITWQGHKDLLGLGWWNPNYTEASQIRGSDGGIYPPFVEKSSPLPLFSRDLCRSMSISYESDFDLDGIRTYRFGPSPDALNASEANRGFCWPSSERYYSEDVQTKLDGGWCLPSGMLDVSKCYSNSPLVMTCPQFALCPDEVIESVNGLYEPSDDFMTYIDLEPTTGIVLAAAKRLQINVAMYADPKRPLVFMKMKPIVLPILWLNESIVLKDDFRKEISQKLISAKSVAYAGAYSAIGVGAFFFVLGIILILILFVRRKNSIGDKGVCIAPPAIDAADDNPE